MWSDISVSSRNNYSLHQTISLKRALILSDLYFPIYAATEIALYCLTMFNLFCVLEITNHIKWQCIPFLDNVRYLTFLHPILIYPIETRPSATMVLFPAPTFQTPSILNLIQLQLVAPQWQQLMTHHQHPCGETPIFHPMI